jgi:hypothetical protein
MGRMIRSRSTTEVLKDTEKEESKMYMPPSVSKKNTAPNKKETIVSHHPDQGTMGLLDKERRICTSGDVGTCQGYRLFIILEVEQQQHLLVQDRLSRSRYLDLQRCRPGIRISQIDINGHWDHGGASASEQMCEHCWCTDHARKRHQCVRRIQCPYQHKL